MTTKIDLNNAPLKTLQEFCGVGPSGAKAIVNFRTINGKFTRKNELLEVPSIGKGKYERIASDSYLGPVPPLPTMSRHAFRRLHKDVIKSARRKGSGLDVCHIVSASRGGADHPDNYTLADASFNRSIQHRNDELMFELVGEKKTAEAIRASRINNSFPLSVPKRLQERHHKCPRNVGRIQGHQHIRHMIGNAGMTPNLPSFSRRCFGFGCSPAHLPLISPRQEWYPPAPPNLKPPLLLLKNPKIPSIMLKGPPNTFIPLDPGGRSYAMYRLTCGCASAKCDCNKIMTTMAWVGH